MKKKISIKQILNDEIEKKKTQNKRDMNFPSNHANRSLILEKKK
jgi:hypothetical protein